MPSDTCVCVIGVGHVGLCLLEVFGRSFDCIGYDISESRMNELRSRRIFDNYSRCIELTTDEAILSRGTHYLIAVPTLLHEDRSINLEHVKDAIQTVMRYARPYCCIVIESSVAVGTTRSLLGPYKNRYHCGMSPERIDAGREFPTKQDIPKIVSGLTEPSLKQINALYSRVFTTTVLVSSTETAEMCKNAENCQRMVLISYVNEISDACEDHGIDVHEMLAACATKPFGYSPFQPGLGVGGRCIPVNPFYLMANNKLPVLERATRLMIERPKKKARKIHEACTRSFGALSSLGSAWQPRILIVGVGFKPGQSDVSGSPALSFAQELLKLGCARLAFYDPLVRQQDVPWLEKLDEQNWEKSYIDIEFDAVVACIKQDGVDLSVMQELDRAMLVSFFHMARCSSQNESTSRSQGVRKSPMKAIRLFDSFGTHILRPLVAQMQHV